MSILPLAIKVGSLVWICSPSSLALPSPRFYHLQGVSFHELPATSPLEACGKSSVSVSGEAHLKGLPEKILPIPGGSFPSSGEGFGALFSPATPQNVMARKKRINFEKTYHPQLESWGSSQLDETFQPPTKMTKPGPYGYFSSGHNPRMGWQPAEGDSSPVNVENFPSFSADGDYQSQVDKKSENDSPSSTTSWKTPSHTREASHAVGRKGSVPSEGGGAQKKTIPRVVHAAILRQIQNEAALYLLKYDSEREQFDHEFLKLDKTPAIMGDLSPFADKIRILKSDCNRQWDIKSVQEDLSVVILCSFPHYEEKNRLVWVLDEDGRYRETEKLVEMFQRLIVRLGYIYFALMNRLELSELEVQIMYQHLKDWLYREAFSPDDSLPVLGWVNSQKIEEARMNFGRPQKVLIDFLMQDDKYPLDSLTASFTLLGIWIQHGTIEKQLARMIKNPENRPLIQNFQVSEESIKLMVDSVKALILKRSKKGGKPEGYLRPQPSKQMNLSG